MGLATRWLRSLWGRRKKESSHPREETPGHNRREGKSSSFTKSRREESDVELGRNADTAVAEAAWIRSLRAERAEKSKHALAVAAATAAAAEAVVAAAQAAVAVVRLTSQGWGGIASGSLQRHSAAAIKIQTAFRRYLAKKAFRALKALVKLQALVRGYLVRRQAAATLHSMQALIKAQAAVRARRARSLLLSDSVPREFLPRRSLERYDETRSAHTPSLHRRRLSATLDSAKTVKMDTSRSRWRSARRSDDDYLHSFSSTIEYRCNFQEDEKCRQPLTAQTTPRCTSSSGYVDEEGTLGRFWNAPRRPSYMAKTQSFEAKLRSQSAPRQRAGPAGARQWSSELPMQKSCSRALEASFDFKSAIVGKLDKSGFNMNS